ncbi:hypothetical protein HOP50_01g00120 [Chloropicon primus]|nr:hypothetical protein HOP50_01g00120 [Chloropicon primus]
MRGETPLAVTATGEASAPLPSPAPRAALPVALQFFLAAVVAVLTAAVGTRVLNPRRPLAREGAARGGGEASPRTPSPPGLNIDVGDMLEAASNGAGNGAERGRDEEAVDRLSRKLEAAKELHENQQLENKEQLSYAREEIGKMRFQIQDLEGTKRKLEREAEEAARRLKEREEEVHRLQARVFEAEDDQPSASRNGAPAEASSVAPVDAGVQGRGAESVRAVVDEMQRQHEEECRRYIGAEFEGQKELLADLQSKTDFVYERLKAQGRRSQESESAEGDGGVLDDDAGGLEAPIGVLAQEAGGFAAQLDSELWKTEVESLEQVNHALHELLRGQQDEYEKRVSEFFFGMLSLKYELTRARLDAGSSSETETKKVA